MSEAPEYVRMSPSILQNLLVSGGVKILIERTQNLTFNVFCLNCEGSRSRARLQTNTYACMVELQTFYVYVCFESETSEHVCMSQAAERVCLYGLLIIGSPILVRKSLQSMDTFAQNEIKP